MEISNEILVNIVAQHKFQNIINSCRLEIVSRKAKDIQRKITL